MPGKMKADPSLVCSDRISIRDVLERISMSPILSQVVVDGDGRVVGVITDGDVRRALLRGLSLDKNVREAMSAHPVLGRVGDDRANRRQLASTRSIIPFLPIVDDGGRLVSVLVGSSRQPTPAALVMAGGFGSRLGERTRSTPKPLLPVAGKPILEHVLARLEQALIGDIFISVHYLADQIADFVSERPSRSSVQLLHEETQLGTAGALGLLPQSLLGPVLIMNGDVVSNVDVEALVDFYSRHDFDGAVAVARYETRIPYGVIRQDNQGLLSAIDEKPLQTHLVAAGIYMVGPELRSLVTAGEAIDMPVLLMRGREAGLKIGLFPVHEYWKDVGRPVDLDAADKEAADLPERTRR